MIMILRGQIHPLFNGALKMIDGIFFYKRNILIDLLIEPNNDNGV